MATTYEKEKQLEQEIAPRVEGEPRRASRCSRSSC